MNKDRELLEQDHPGHHAKSGLKRSIGVKKALSQEAIAVIPLGEAMVVGSKEVTAEVVGNGQTLVIFCHLLTNWMHVRCMRDKEKEKGCRIKGYCLLA